MRATSSGGTPMCSRNEAVEWRRSWKRRRGSPAVTMAAGNPFEIVVVQRRPRPAARPPTRPFALRDGHHREDQLGPVLRPDRADGQSRLVLARPVAA